MEMRRLWNAEWLILRDQPKDPEARREFLRTYSGPSPFFDILRDNYLSKMDHMAEIARRELDCAEACAAK